MSSDSPGAIYTIPLFPLHFVLFPQFPLQLHVFEERYRVMIGECIERQQPFGVILIAEGEEAGAPAVPRNVGCVARILAVTKLDDGRMNLLAVGQKRFRLLEYAEGELPYLIGRAETLTDSDNTDEDPDRLLRDLSRLFRKYLRLLALCSGKELPSVALPDDPTILGFCIAAVTQMDVDDKQSLLEMTDPVSRLKFERRVLRRQIRELEALKPADDAAPEPHQPELQLLIAERLDTSRDFWRDYLSSSRN
ncbi:MAG TPA: LON peptidase substrate-binding domain-containing protein [Chthonomonadaceae bacterium]|nr:LON peptidase substrate-binding domain-containing protein [Chthonomonadaceae bacterium]